MSSLTNKEEIFPSIYIEATKDLTERVTPREAGAICTAGYMDIGNPLYALNVTSAFGQLKSTKTLNGGNPKNETLYHIKDYLGEYQGRVYMARILGENSVTRDLKIYDDEGADIDINGSVGIYHQIIDSTGVVQVPSLETWGDSTDTNPMAILLKICPQKKVIVDVVSSPLGDETFSVKITIQDEFGNTIYSVSGNSDKAHTNDYEESDYIGNIADDRVIGIKIDSASFSALGAFSVTTDFEAGELLDDIAGEA